MSKITVWTKQHRAVLEQLEATGRYTATRSGILTSEEAQLKMTCYNWLAQAMPQQHRPPDAEYPIWVCLSGEHAMLPSANAVILELEVDSDLMTPINEAKWGTIANFSYIPMNPQDDVRHSRMLDSYGISDAKAVMTPFYPAVRQEVIASWNRLFDPDVRLGSSYCDGVLWEVRKEWIRSIRK